MAALVYKTYLTECFNEFEEKCRKELEKINFTTTKTVELTSIVFKKNQKGEWEKFHRKSDFNFWVPCQIPSNDSELYGLRQHIANERFLDVCIKYNLKPKVIDRQSLTGILQSYLMHSLDQREEISEIFDHYLFCLQPFSSQQVQENLSTIRQNFQKRQAELYQMLRIQFEKQLNGYLSSPIETCITGFNLRVGYIKDGKLAEHVLKSKRLWRKCQTCQKWQTTAHKLSYCICEKVSYCNPDCQKMDRNAHKIHCKK